jgi:hypothetical protein
MSDCENCPRGEGMADKKPVKMCVMVEEVIYEDFKNFVVESGHNASECSRAIVIAGLSIVRDYPELVETLPATARRKYQKITA